MGREVRDMKTLGVLLAAVVLAATACQAGQGFASADAGVFLLLGSNPAENPIMRLLRRYVPRNDRYLLHHGVP